MEDCNSLAAIFDLEIKQMDAVMAFLNAKADTDIDVKLPPGYEELAETLPEGMVALLLKALYGLKQAPRLWQQDLSNAFKELGYTSCLSDPSVYTHPKTQIITVTYYDNMLIVGPKMRDIRIIQKQLKSKFEMESLGPARFFLGIKIKYSRAKYTIKLSREAYIDKMLKHFGMEDCAPVDTPMAAGAAEFMVPNLGIATQEEIDEYGSMISSEMYLAIQTCADIAYNINTLS